MTLRPDDKALRVYLGGMHAATGRVGEAAAILDPVVAADPSHFDATMHLASGYLLAGNLDRAAAYAARALTLRPASADAAKLQGMVHWQEGRTRDAEVLLTAAAAADPRDPMPHLWMGMILGQQARYLDARRQFAAAETALKRAEQAEPANPRLQAARERIVAAARGQR